MSWSQTSLNMQHLTQFNESLTDECGRNNPAFCFLEGWGFLSLAALMWKVCVEMWGLLAADPPSSHHQISLQSSIMSHFVQFRKQTDTGVCRLHRRPLLHSKCEASSSSTGFLLVSDQRGLQLFIFTCYIVTYLYLHVRKYMFELKTLRLFIFKKH